MNYSSIKKDLDPVAEKALKKNIETINIDWFGTMLMSGLLEYGQFERTGEIRAFAEKWMEYHIKRQPGLTDDEYRNENSGTPARIIREYIIPIGTYAGYFGLSFTAYKLYKYYSNIQARHLCIDISDCILHHCARNNLGLVMHDDGEKAFTIPDVCYFVAPPLLNGAILDGKQGFAFRRHGELQLKGFIDTFLTQEEKIAKTVFINGRLGDTFWIRASGWLLWAIVDTLEQLSPESEYYNYILKRLQDLAEGLSAHQEVCGGFHVLMNESNTPLETTGTAMIAYGLHKSVRLGWIQPSYLDTASKAWEYAASKIGPDGTLTGCYSGWALPAENREMHFDQPMNWMPGLILITGTEMMRGIQAEERRENGN